MTYAKRTDANRHKYGAKPTVVDGIRFASQKEARRYGELKLLEKAGEIWNLNLQPRYELSTLNCSSSTDQERLKIGEYRADFLYLVGKKDDWLNSTVVVEDVKGFKTPLYRWKKKHVEAQYGIEIREV